MCLHDRIVRELEQTRSLAALIYLIDHGREIEFSWEGRDYFLSRSHAQKAVSLWNGRGEQSFDGMEELLETAAVSDTGATLPDVLPMVQLKTIF